MPAMTSTSGLSQRAKMAGGQPISHLMHQALANPNLISLAAGFVDPATLPVELAGEAVAALLADPTEARRALQYGTNSGLAPLREALLERFHTADGTTPAETGLTLDNLVVTAGSNELLHLLADTLFDPGDIVLCGAPEYFVYLGVLGNLDVRAIGVAIDDQGMIPEALEAELARLDAAGELSRVKAIYITSYYSNPSTVTLSAARRPRIVALAERYSRAHRIYVIDDAAYRELRYAGDDTPSLRAYDSSGETVIVAQTFSKCFSPGIRVGYGILPRALVEPVLNQKGNIDFGAPNFTQHLIWNVIERGQLDAHVERLRASYRSKLAAMLDALEEHLGDIPGVSWRRPTGGLYVWLELPEGLAAGPASKLFGAAVAAGVLYVPGEYCFPREGVPVRRNSIRLSFGVQNEPGIARGIAALGRAIRDVLS
ncbi:MAG: PLP-dependent aminotransferase family protein [Planctomycetaceae bacterium]|nr:PLP-dependent aminotransferase family protein [Planctomycetaceae bacterium]